MENRNPPVAADSGDPGRRSVAVAIPCYNEAVTVAKVVSDFQKALPGASVHVFDNNSSDGTGEIARRAGANVHRVPKQGKGHVLQAIFAVLEADAVVLVDGDDTYFAEEAPALLECVLRGEADMAVGNRLVRADSASLRLLHQFGNRIIVDTINRMFDTHFEDILSGYRVFGRRFIQEVPLLTSGFEIETEMTLQALDKGMTVKELPISYRNRPAGSVSKLRSFRDGYRIMMTSAILLRDHHPLRLFGFVSAVCLMAATVAGVLRLLTFLGALTVPPALTTGLLLLFGPLGLISLGLGLVLSAINARFKELNQLMHRRMGRNG